VLALESAPSVPTAVVVESAGNRVQCVEADGVEVFEQQLVNGVRDEEKKETMLPLRIREVLDRDVVGNALEQL
jgi:hypothetical protein